MDVRSFGNKLFICKNKQKKKNLPPQKKKNTKQKTKQKKNKKPFLPLTHLSMMGHGHGPQLCNELNDKFMSTNQSNLSLFLTKTQMNAMGHVNYLKIVRVSYNMFLLWVTSIWCSVQCLQSDLRVGMSDVQEWTEPGGGYLVERWVRGCAARIGYFFGRSGLPMAPFSFENWFWYRSHLWKMHNFQWFFP